MRIIEQQAENRDITIAIPERNRLVMYFLWLAVAISGGVVLAKAVRAYSA